ncbi:hypothetical protein BKA70DRAFT_1439367 [Coprinopsis sp. MPI-PUGE-AT-0042]|nr:hypothetical protein BKA70DRAFT_1439367 [Coprinopsis sp. MPI-PUGE-AT-0042]
MSILRHLCDSEGQRLRSYEQWISYLLELRGESCDASEKREGGKPVGTFRSGFEDYSPAKDGLHLEVNDAKSSATPYASSAMTQPGFVGGVRDLPGNRSKHGIALTLEERLHPAGLFRQDQTHSMEHASGPVAGVVSYRRAEETAFGILRPDKQQKHDGMELAKLQAENSERFEAEERRRLEADIRAMVQDKPSRRGCCLSAVSARSSSQMPTTDRGKPPSPEISETQSGKNWKHAGPRFSQSNAEILESPTCICPTFRS